MKYEMLGAGLLSMMGRGLGIFTDIYIYICRVYVYVYMYVAMDLNKSIEKDRGRKDGRRYRNEESGVNR